MSDDTKALQNRATDYTAATLKGVLGAVPIVGSAMAEIVGGIIPNQRIDRLADFAKKLAEKVAQHDAALIQKRLMEPEGVDILEEALWQSARALSEERRTYVAALVKNGLSKDQIDLLQTKKLLLLLSQVNDLEILLLRFYAYHGAPDEEFQKKFGDAVKPVSAWVGAPQDQVDKHAISESMRAHLVRLGLLKPTFPFVTKGQLPEFDRVSGSFKAAGNEITPLGQLLLRTIDFDPQ